MAEVRPAVEADASAIRAVHQLAFPTAAEARLVDALDRSGDTVVSLVAAEGSEIVGHILLSRMKAEGDGRSYDALGLAPVAVLPDRQSRGIGSALVEAGLAAARDKGAEFVFLLGEPEYYGRFGFDAATAAPFASPYAGPYFQAAVLTPDLRLPNSGRADYAPPFAELG